MLVQRAMTPTFLTKTGSLHPEIFYFMCRELEQEISSSKHTCVKKYGALIYAKKSNKVQL